MPRPSARITTRSALTASISRLEDQLGGRKVDIDLPRDLPLVPVDAVLIEQVLINLLENATKYTPPGGDIDVSLGQEDGMVVLRVRDSGMSPR